MALCVTTCRAVVPFLIVLLLLLSVLPKVLAEPWLSSLLGNAATPLAEPSRGGHLLPFGAGIGTFNQANPSEPSCVLKKSLLCSPAEVPSIPRSSERLAGGFCIGGLLFAKDFEGNDRTV